MNDVYTDVANRAVRAAQVIGADRVKSILAAHYVERVGQLTLSHVNGFLLDLERVLGETQNCKPYEAPQAQTCGEPAPAPTVPSQVDFEPLYAAVRDAREAIGYHETGCILLRFGSISPVCLEVRNVNLAIAALREAMAATTPTRKALKEYIESGAVPLPTGAEHTLMNFADWLDSRATQQKTTAAAPAGVGYEEVERDDKAGDARRYRK